MASEAVTKQCSTVHAWDSECGGESNPQWEKAKTKIYPCQSCAGAQETVVSNSAQS